MPSNSEHHRKLIFPMRIRPPPYTSKRPHPFRQNGNSGMRSDCFYRKSGFQLFRRETTENKKEKSLESEDSRLLELLGRFELPTSSLPTHAWLISLVGTCRLLSQVFLASQGIPVFSFCCLLWRVLRSFFVYVWFLSGFLSPPERVTPPLFTVRFDRLRPAPSGLQSLGR